MSRRGENIRKRADGRWEGRYKAVNTVTGKSCYHSVYAKTYRDVRSKLFEAKARRQPGREERARTNGGEGLLLKEAAAEWLGLVEKKRKYSTFVKYSNIYKAYIEPTCGELTVDRIEPLSFQRANAEHSDSITKSIASVMNQILKYAADEYRTPCRTVTFEGKKSAGRTVEVLTSAEQERLICTLAEQTDIYKLGILLCLSTGLRLGELCALKWEDIDLKNKLLHVNRTVQRIAVADRETKTVLWESEPKSCFSKREIPLADELVRQLNEKRSDGYLFRRIRPMEPRTYQNKFDSYLRASGIPKKNFHILRHTFATNCIENGTDVKSLSELLGHADVKITLNRYVHPTTETKRRHINSLAAIYGKYVGQKVI